MTDLPPGWAMITLGEIATSFKNGIFVSRPGSEPNGVPILRISAVRPGRLNISDVRYSGQTVAALTSADSMLNSGDLLFTRYNGTMDLVGACALVPPGAGPLTYPDKLIRVRTDTSVAVPLYVSYAFASPHVRSQVRAATRTTAGQVGISAASLRSIRLPLPPLAEQRRIVAILEDHLSCLDAARGSLERCEARLLHFIDSARTKSAGMPPTAIAAGLAYGNGWGTLSDVLDGIEAGRSFACEPRPASQDEWGVIKVSAMTWGEFREHENKAVPPGRAIDLRYEIRPGDILVSRANTPSYVGAPVMVENCRPRLLLSDKSLRLKPRPDVHRRWLIHVLSSKLVRQQISELATGTKESMRNISQSSLLSVRIPLSSPEDQRRIAAEIDEVRDRAYRIQETVRKSLLRHSGLRSAIMTAAFEGRLVAQDPNDEPASVLLERIRRQREIRPKLQRQRRTASASQKETLL